MRFFKQLPVVIAGIYEAFSSAFVRRRLQIAGGSFIGGRRTEGHPR
jgi:hypothetical protein